METRTGLEQYAYVGRDNFMLADSGTVKQFRGDLAFPCCVCLNNDRDDRDWPCMECDRNVNANARHTPCQRKG